MQSAAELGTTPEARGFSITRLLRTIFIDGGRFWERGRLAYNTVQLLLTGVMVAIHWPESHFFFANLDSYVAFALIANVLYSAAYFPEALLQIPQFRPFARPVRWCLLIAGTAFACVLAAAVLDVFILCDPAQD